VTRSARRLLLGSGSVLVALALLVSIAQAAGWAWLGVRIREMSEHEMEEISARHGIREGFGVVIVDVVDGAPAARAGMKSGDIVVAFDGKPVTDTRTLQRLIAAAPVDDDSRLTVLGPAGRRALRVRLAPMPREVAGERVAAEFGFSLREADAPSGTGPLASVPTVSVVMRGSAAERAGLQAGDVLLQVGERAVITREAAREALAEAGLERPLRLIVRRAQAHIQLTLSAL
jgi:serine protease Do